MKVQDIIKETTSAAIAAVVAPMGTMKRRKQLVNAAPNPAASQDARQRVAIPLRLRNLPMAELQDEMVQAKRDGRMIWKAMSAEINRRAKGSRFEPKGQSIIHKPIGTIQQTNPTTDQEPK